MRWFIFFFIILICIFVRFYKISSIPIGFHIDEAALGYNAYSILKTGEDEYGQLFPVFLRSFGTYASPLYAYLTILPFGIFGLSIMSSRLMGVILGCLVIIATYLIVLKELKNTKQALIAASVLGLSPWAIFMSRGAYEAQAGFVFFASGSIFLLLGLQRKVYLFIGTFLLGLSIYGYQAERLLANLFYLFFIILFWKRLGEIKLKFVLICLFISTQLPQLLILGSSGSLARISQISYFNLFLNQNYTNTPLLNPILSIVFIIREFLSQYIAYFSPMNLFFKSDPFKFRSVPDLSIFYPWMIIPFILGIRAALRKRKENLIKILLMVGILSPVPASLTRDPFSTFRILPLLWVITIFISFGIYELFILIPNILYRSTVVTFIIFITIVHLYSSYFILLNYERAKDYDYGYKQMVDYIQHYNFKKVVVDSELPRAYIEILFYSKFDPDSLHQIIDKKITRNYYNFTEFNPYYTLGNVFIRPIDWGTDANRDTLIIGNQTAISIDQIKDHQLIQVFEIKDLTGVPLILGYKSTI